jgi:hypothetical protein
MVFAGWQWVYYLNVRVVQGKVMSEEPNTNQRRRPGPIGFSSESSITSNRMSEAPNPGGIGRAATPRKETPRVSKELKVAGPNIWLFIGVAVTVLGIIFVSVAVIAVGTGVCVASLMVSRMNKTQVRLRQDIRSNAE